MQWNDAAYRVFGEPMTEHPDALVRLAGLEDRIGSRLPAAAREWFAVGGDERLAAIADNNITILAGLTEPGIGRFLTSGYLLLETDAQHCCQWVTPIVGQEDDPPVHLIDPDDYTCSSRARYADRFSSYTFACAWDALLWHDNNLLTDFDHPLNGGALERLGAQPFRASHHVRLGHEPRVRRRIPLRGHGESGDCS